MQNRRALLFLIFAIALGVGAALTAQRWLEEQRQKPVEKARATTQAVAVVRQNMQVGQVVHERELATVDWPLEYLPQGAHADPRELDGRVLRRPLAAGEPVLEAALLPEGSRAGLISVIDPTRRAISVQVDEVIGVAGFVVPGSHVDIIGTVEPDEAEPWSKVILQDIEVLAIDQKLEEAEEGEPELVQVVTLEVSPEETEKLAFASNQGRLQLALRNPTDHEVVDTRAIRAAELLNERKPVVAVSRPVRRAPGANVEVIKGSQVSVQSF